MKKQNGFYIFLSLLLLPGIGNLQKTVGKTKGITVYNSTNVSAEGGSIQSTVSTTVNGEKVTVQSNQQGSIEVKDTNGKVEIKTSAGITPTIILTGSQVQTDSVSEEKEKELVFPKQEKSVLGFQFFNRIWKRLLIFFNKT